MLSSVRQELSTTTKLYIATPTEDGHNCQPVTLIQGPETFEFHLSFAAPTTWDRYDAGAWSTNGACNWQGAVTTANLTCSGTRQGTAFYPSTSIAGTTTMDNNELRLGTPYLVLATIVTPEASSGATASATNLPGSSPSILAAWSVVAAGIFVVAWAL